MKRTLSVIFAAIAALMACGALAVSPAAAAACHKKAGSLTHAVCIGGQALGSPEEVKIETFATHSKVGTKARFDGESLMFGVWSDPLECEMTGQGLLESGKGRVKESQINFTFRNCEYPTEPSCSVGEVNRTTNMQGALGSAGLFEYTAESGSGLFASFSVGNAPKHTCPAAMHGEYVLEGHFSAIFKEVEVEMTEHELFGEKGQHTITIYSSPNELSSTQEIELTGAHKGQKFSIIEGS